MKTIASILAVLSITVSLLNAQPATPTAQDVMAAAEAKASAEHKTIFLHFGASWCIWCHRLEAFLEKPEVKPVFEKYFVPVKLDVQEQADKKGLENKGADALLEKFGGPGGLPYSAFLDAKGGLIINSKLDGNNIGFPGEPKEIDHFIVMIKKAAPNISPDDVKAIETALKNFKTT